MGIQLSNITVFILRYDAEKKAKRNGPLKTDHFFDRGGWPEAG